MPRQCSWSRNTALSAFLLAGCGGLGHPSAALAETGTPCDASVEIAGCRAHITVEGKWLVVRSNTPRCSRVDWTMDGYPRTATIIDGEDRLALLTATAPKQITIERCVEVKDVRPASEIGDIPADSPEPGEAATVTIRAPCICGENQTPSQVFTVSGRTRDEAVATAQARCVAACPPEKDEPAPPVATASSQERATRCSRLKAQFDSASSASAAHAASAADFSGLTNLAEKCAHSRQELDSLEREASKKFSLARQLAEECLSAERRGPTLAATDQAERDTSRKIAANRQTVAASCN